MEDTHRTRAQLLEELAYLRQRVAELETAKATPGLAEKVCHRPPEEATQSQRLLLALSKAAQAVQRARTTGAVYHTLGEQTTALGLDVTVFTLSEDRKHLLVSYLTLKEDLVHRTQELVDLSLEDYRCPLIPGGFFQRIIVDGEAVFDKVDAARIAEALPPSARPLAGRLVDLLGWKQTIYAPMTVGGEVWGLLAVTGTNLTESAVPAVTAFANQAAIAIENARLYKETQQLAAFNQSIIQSMAEGIVVQDADGIFTFVNPAAAERLGYAPDELIGQHWKSIIPPDQWPFVHAADARRMQGEADRYELELVRQDGTRITAIVAGSPRFDEEGQFAGTMAVFTDITERKRAEDARARLTAQVREQARRMEQVLATVPAGVLLLDTEGCVLQANPTAEGELAALAGAEVGDVLTHLGERPLATLLTAPPDGGLWHEVKAESVAGERIYEVIARPMQPTMRAITANQALNGRWPEAQHWVLVINDVTREREIQVQLQQQERLAAVGQLAAGIAHDFNNIMASIVLYAQMVARSQALSAGDRERMDVITQQAWHASRLIQQILDFSRRTVLERRPLDLLPLLKEQIKLLERTLPEHIDINLDYGTDTYQVEADPTRMQQMLTNLAVNARDAMPQGGKLRVGLQHLVITPGQTPPLPEMEPGTWIQLTVSDTGTGISPDVLPHIFEPFFTTKGPGEGSGLGLAQVHGIVGLHEGHIDVETQVGAGTTFIIYLPALEVHKTVRSSSEDATVPQGHREVVLVVEDETALRTALTEILELLNYQTLEAANGQEAMTMLAAQGKHIDLVLSDIIMPEMGGMALLHALRARGWHRPVILLTGHPMDQTLEDLRAQGVAAWLTKPPSFEQLAQVVADALQFKAS